MDMTRADKAILAGSLLATLLAALVLPGRL
jgi:hypothetical protein